uniref:CS domain-containing protein n=1 Tax=Alexandrium catenella TaxID=2925 RepID=A0A7S1PKZ4_ALECA
MGGGKGGGKGEKDEGEKEAEGGKYHWQQKGEEIQVRFPAEPPLTKKDVAVTFKRAALLVKVRGEALIDGALASTVEVDECTWCLAPGGVELQVMLTKQREGEWPALLSAK